jgi:hypothetical protein
MLDAPAAVVSAATNAKSSKVTPVVSPITCSAYPVAGATVASLLAAYVHVAGVVVQSNPPKTVTPSTAVATARFSA